MSEPIARTIRFYAEDWRAFRRLQVALEEQRGVARLTQAEVFSAVVSSASAVITGPLHGQLPEPRPPDKRD